MAYSESQPTVSLTAETTFAGTDLHKFVELNSAGRVVVGGTATTSAIPIGTLLSATYSTSTGANETVTVGLLQGIGQVFMAGSTSATGNIVAASSAGFGTIPTTDAYQVGTIVAGSSGTTGRIHAVLFHDVT